MNNKKTINQAPRTKHQAPRTTNQEPKIFRVIRAQTTNNGLTIEINN